MARYDASTIAALHEALEDEYRARATYAAVIERFGAVRPFTNIIAAEDRHARALERLLTAAGLSIPADPWAGRVAAPDSLAAALALGVQAEIDNRTMYDRLATVTTAPEVRQVFASLRRASQDNHLPAFQRRLAALSGAAAPLPDADTAADITPAMAAAPRSSHSAAGGIASRLAPTSGRRFGGGWGGGRDGRQGDGRQGDGRQGRAAR